MRSKLQPIITELANEALLVSFENFSAESVNRTLMSGLTLANQMRGYNYRELSPLIVKKAFNKKVYDRLSMDQCLQLLRRGHELEFA